MVVLVDLARRAWRNRGEQVLAAFGFSYIVFVLLFSGITFPFIGFGYGLTSTFYVSLIVASIYRVDSNMTRPVEGRSPRPSDPTVIA